jgi:hypothetical protein
MVAAFSNSHGIHEKTRKGITLINNFSVSFRGHDVFRHQVEKTLATPACPALAKIR